MYLWVIYALASALFISGRDLLAKQVFIKDNIEHKHILFQEYLFYLVVIGGLFFTRIDFASVTSHWDLYLFKAASVGMAGFLYLKLLREHDITAVAPLTNLSPIVLLLLSYLFLGEVLAFWQIVGMVLTVLATYYLEIILAHHRQDKVHRAHWYSLRKKETVFFLHIFFLLLTLSLAATADKLVLERVDVATNLFFTSVGILTALFLIYRPATALQSIRIWKRCPRTFAVVVLNLLSTACILLAIAVPSALVSLIIPLRRTATFYTSLFGGLLFHEDHLPKKLLAVAVMVAGVFLLVIG